MNLPRHTCACVDVQFGTYAAAVGLIAPPAMRQRYPRGVDVDVCLALEVTWLWNRGVVTTGCCCGHGRLEPTIGVKPASIPVMLTLGYEPSLLAAGREDIFTAKSGWPIAEARA